MAYHHQPAASESLSFQVVQPYERAGLIGESFFEEASPATRWRSPGGLASSSAHQTLARHAARALVNLATCTFGLKFKDGTAALCCWSACSFLLHRLIIIILTRASSSLCRAWTTGWTAAQSVSNVQSDHCVMRWSNNNKRLPNLSAPREFCYCGICTIVWHPAILQNPWTHLVIFGSTWRVGRGNPSACPQDDTWAR